jgi:hypothetical protein
MRRKLDPVITSKLKYPAKCKGYVEDGKIKFAKDHQEIVMVGKGKEEFALCFPCYRARIDNRDLRSFIKLNKSRRPKAIRDILTIIKYIETKMKEGLNIIPEERYVMLAILHRDATSQYITELEKYYGN